MSRILTSIALLAAACGPGSRERSVIIDTSDQGDADADTDSDSDTDGDTDSDTDPDACGGAENYSDMGDMPSDPSPFTLNTYGSEVLSLTFDTPTCTYHDSNGQLRMFWRGSSHVFVLYVEMLADFDGVCTYTEGDGVNVKLQEEAGGSASSYASEDKDAIEMVVEGFAEDAVWGQVNVEKIEGGSMIFEPAGFPIWCDDFP